MVSLLGVGTEVCAWSCKMGGLAYVTVESSRDACRRSAVVANDCLSGWRVSTKRARETAITMFAC